jgi:N-acetylmuramic acid 6-phosphate etherase
MGLDKMSALEITKLMNHEERAVLTALERAADPIALAAERVAQAFKDGGKIIYIGAGTSGRIAQADAAEMTPTFGIEPGRFIALIAEHPLSESPSHRLTDSTHHSTVEDPEDDEHAAIEGLNALGIGPGDAAIGLAASGRTPFTIAAIKHAKQKGVWTCGIANVRDVPLLREAEHSIFLDTGPEVLTGSTRLKAGTAQKLVLNRISTAAMVLCGKVIENLMVDVQAKNSKLKDRCVRIVRELTTADSGEAREALERTGWNVRKAIESLRQAAPR